MYLQPGEENCSLFLNTITKVPSYICIVELAWRFPKGNNQNKFVSLYVIPGICIEGRLDVVFTADNSTLKLIVVVFCSVEFIIKAELSKYEYKILLEIMLML